MTCRDCTTFLAEYIAGELADSTRVTFEAHLGSCGNCRVFIEQYRQTIVAERVALTTEDASTPDLPEDLVRAILNALDKA